MICEDCQLDRQITIQSLKNQLRRQNIRCIKCSIKHSWKDPNRKIKQHQVWENPEYRKNQSIKRKQLWENPEYRSKQAIKTNARKHDILYKKRMSRKSKELWENPEYQSSQIKSKKQLWKTEEYRKNQKISKTDKFKKNQSVRQHQVWENPEYRKNQSVRQHQVWENPKYKQQQSVIQSQIWKNLELKERQSRLQKQRWENPEYRQYFEKIWKSEEYRKKLSESLTKRWQNPELRNQASESLKKRWQNPELTSLFKDKFEFIQKEFKFIDLIIHKFNQKFEDSRLFLNSFHYAQFGRSAKVIYGAYLDDQLIAICKFATPVRKEVATSMGYSYSEVLELDRFCIHPEYQKKNFASWLISRCSKLMFEESPKIKCLVSFADTTYGHLGTIYKAANWKEIGRTKPDYHYINNDGFVLHKKTLYNHAVKMNKKEREYAEEYGYIKVYGKEKIKFLY